MCFVSRFVYLGELREAQSVEKRGACGKIVIFLPGVVRWIANRTSRCRQVTDSDCAVLSIGGSVAFATGHSIFRQRSKRSATNHTRLGLLISYQPNQKNYLIQTNLKRKLKSFWKTFSNSFWTNSKENLKTKLNIICNMFCLLAKKMLSVKN